MTHARLVRNRHTLASLVLISISLAAVSAHAQALATGAATSSAIAASSNGEGPAGLVPFTRGFNLSLGSTSQHDSTNGWSSLLTPNLAYRFGPHWSVNVNVPVYATVDTYQKTAAAHGTVPAAYAFVNHHFVPGDAAAVGEFAAHPAGLDYELSATLGIPTGNAARGLGAGHATYEINNRFERAIGDYITPDIELGIDDSPNLNNLRVRKSYTVAGTSAHFQAGLGISLPRNMSLSSDMYEELPIGSQTVTGKKKKAASSTQATDAEDNGFLNTLDVPVTRHVTVSGFYNHSLHDDTDIAGVSLTFLLRAAPRHLDSPL